MGKFYGSTEGACLCGTVTIALKDAKPLIDVCHCTMCRRWGGGPFLGIGGTNFAMTGKATITTYPSSDWAERAFCGTCGSHLYYRFLPTNHYSFLAGVFDMADSIEIEQQIFVDEKPGYYDFTQRTPMKTGADIIAEAEAQGISFED
ncbi:MAG: GFA family protein [Pontixanthobacter sp.]